MEHYPIIVCYAGGTCGDLITTMIDASDSQLAGSRFAIDLQRSRLKKPHTFANQAEKDSFLHNTKYKSVPSHDLAYHIEKNHRFIGIRVQDPSTALWAATRFKQLHRPHVWDEMVKLCGANSVEAYAQTLIDFGNYMSLHTDKILHLEHIVAGTVIDQLAQMVETPLDIAANTYYNNWIRENQCKPN